MAKRLTKALVFLPIPGTLLSAQMSSGHEILYLRFNLPLGKAREGLLLCWKWIFPEKKEGREC